MGWGVRMRKLRKDGVSCSRCSAAAKNGKTFDNGWGSKSSEWKVKNFIERRARRKANTQGTRDAGQAERESQCKNGRLQKAGLTRARSEMELRYKRIKIYEWEYRKCGILFLRLLPRLCCAVPLVQD